MAWSAFRVRAIRLGRASMRCGFWVAVVAALTFRRSPPISLASDAHSGSQATTLSAARAGMPKPIMKSSRTRRHVGGAARRAGLFMAISSEAVSTMRTEAHDVLQVDLPIGDRRVAAVGGELQAKPAEFGQRVVDHRGGARRPGALQ